MKLGRLLGIVLLAMLIPVLGLAEDYKIGKGDVLDISVWGVPEMSRSVTVRPDGKITLPAVGDIFADKLVPEELSTVIADKMKKFVKKPIVTVSVQQIRNNRVYITGSAVSRVFDMSKETTLLNLFSELGDLSAIDLHDAYLLRNGEKIKTDFISLYYDGDMTQDVVLQADDILFLPSNRSNIVYVLGAVARPQNLQYYQGMRVLDAILATGGFNEFAKENSVYVIDRNQKRTKVNLKRVIEGKDIGSNILLQPGDYVIVDEGIF